MGKTVLTEQTVVIPKGITVDIKGRNIIGKGPLGTVTKVLPNAPILLKKTKKGDLDAITVSMYFGHEKHTCIVKSFAAHIQNVIKGVQYGFKWTMKYGFKRHPMKPVASDDGKSVSISLFLGKKDISVVKADEGVKITCDKDEKTKQVYVEGLDPLAVGNTCLRIYHTCVPRRLDRRKFLDGIYINHKGTIKDLE